MSNPLTNFLEASEVHVQNSNQIWLNLVKQAVVSSNSWPNGIIKKLYESHHPYLNVTRQLNDNITDLCNRILVCDFPKIKFKSSEIEANVEKLNDINSDEIDKIHLKIEKIVKGETDSIETINNKEYDPFHSIMARKRQRKKPTNSCIMAFKYIIDNSSNIWKPKIKVKHNSTVPLNLTIQKDSDGKESYNHPYQVELESYTPPNSFLQPEPAQLPHPDLLEKPYILVNTKDKLASLNFELLNTIEFAVDLEHHEYHSYLGYTCLVQITANNNDYILDTIALREHMHILNDAFTNPNKLKIFHGALNDIRWLQRDFGVYVVGMFDTNIAARVLNWPKTGLSYCLTELCNIETNKGYQKADWRIRPLPEDYILYARIDTHYLKFIYQKFKELLLKEDPSGSLILQVFNESQKLCLKRYNKPKYIRDNHEYMDVIRNHKKKFNERQFATFKHLYIWRDTIARYLDKSGQYILPINIMLKLAENLPKNLKSIYNLCHTCFAKRHVKSIHDIIKSTEPNIWHNAAVAMNLSRNVDNEENSVEMAQALSNVATTSRALPVVSSFRRKRGRKYKKTKPVATETGESSTVAN